MNGRPATQVGKIESCLPIPSIGGAQQRKQGLVLINGQGLTVAKCPAFWRKVETHNLDFRQEWFRHTLYSLTLKFRQWWRMQAFGSSHALGWRRKLAKQRNNKVDA